MSREEDLASRLRARDNPVRRVFKNSAALAVSNVGARVFTALTVIYAARFLGDAAFGQYVTALSLSLAFATLADLGMNPVYIRDVAREPLLAARYLVNLYALKAALGALTFGVVLAAAHLLGYPPETISVVRLLALAVVVDSYGSLNSAGFQAQERMEFVALLSIVSNAAYMAAVILLLSRGGTPVTLGWLTLGRAVFNACVGLGLLRRIVPRGGGRLDLSLIGRLLPEMLPLTLTTLFVSLYSQSDTVMVSRFRPAAEVGWYGAAHKPLDVLTAIPGTIMLALFPIMSRLYLVPGGALGLVYERAMKYMLGFALPLATGAYILADEIILLLFGPAYAAAADVFRVLAGAMLVYYLNTVLATLLISIDAIRFQTVVTGVMLVFYLAVGFVLTSPSGLNLGAVGAAWTVFTGQTLGCGLQAAFVARRLHALSLPGLLAKPLAATCVMSLVLFALRRGHLWILVASGAASYGLALVALGYVDDEDRRLISMLIRGQRSGG